MSSGAGAGAAGHGAIFAVKGGVPGGGGSSGGGTGIAHRPEGPPDSSPDAKRSATLSASPAAAVQDLSMTGRAWPAVGARRGPNAGSSSSHHVWF